MPALSLTFEVKRNALPVIGESVRRRLSKVVKDTADDVLTDAIHEIQNGEKSGRVYMVGGEQAVTFHAGESGDDGPGANRETTVVFNKGKIGVAHQASAPFEAPATETGDLANSGSVRMVDGSLEADVVFTSGHALPLEFGTVDIEPRPFLEPAMKKAEPQFRADCAAALAAGIAEGSK